MKKAILQIIYDAFSTWAEDDRWACRKGCASCCTQNVAITALEGEQILEFILGQNREKWLADKLQGHNAPHRPKFSINALATACMQGRDVAEEEQSAPVPCPFLEQDACSIYPARPFSCRCFLSLHTCSPTRPALVSDSYLAASTAINQLIEHLGQREYWGNMLDVLPALLDISAFGPIAALLQNPTATITAARLHTLRAQPLPGFMLSPEEYQQVSPLLESIFQKKVAGTTVEDILNGR